MTRQEQMGTPFKFKKPPLKLFGWILRCDHVWGTYWRDIDENTSEGVKKCKRCLKEELQ